MLTISMFRSPPRKVGNRPKLYSRNRREEEPGRRHEAAVAETPKLSKFR